MNFPILSSLILLPTVGALFLFFTKDKEGKNSTAKYVALFTTIVNFLISIYLWISFDQSTSNFQFVEDRTCSCLLYTSPSPRDRTRSRMPSSA